MRILFIFAATDWSSVHAPMKTSLMGISLLSACLSFNAGASQTNLVLIQRSASKPPATRKDRRLPSVHEVLDKPAAVFDKMTSQVEALEQRLAEVQKQDSDQVAELQATQAKLLEDQRNEIRALSTQNVDIAAQITEFDTSIKEMRGRANSLVVKNAELSGTLRSLHANITTANAYIDITVNRSNETIDDGLSRLSDVTHSARVGLLQLQSHLEAKVLPTNIPHDILDKMASALAELERQQNATLSALQTSFQDEFQIGGEKLTALLEDQERLNKTKANKARQLQRLTISAKHLEEAHSLLEERCRAIREFSNSMYAIKAPPRNNVPPSLLQVRADSASVSPEMDTHISALETSLSELQQEHQSMIDGLKARSEAKLAAQGKINRELVRENARIAVEINALEKEIRELRETAKELRSSNEHLLSKMHGARTNMTTAQEFIGSVLNSTEEKPEDTADLAILAELDGEDRAQELAAARAHRLAEVDNAADGTALLQLQAGAVFARSKRGSQVKRHPQRKQRPKPSREDRASGPQDIIMTLASSLHGLVQEHNASKTSYMKHYEEELDRLRQQHVELNEVQSRLNATRENDTKTRDRLKVVVSYLNDTHDSLNATRNSLHHFMHNVATNVFSDAKLNSVEVQQRLSILPSVKRLAAAIESWLGYPLKLLR